MVCYLGRVLEGSNTIDKVQVYCLFRKALLLIGGLILYMIQSLSYVSFIQNI